jgi:hypothetical protein
MLFSNVLITPNGLLLTATIMTFTLNCLKVVMYLVIACRAPTNPYVINNFLRHRYCWSGPVAGARIKDKSDTFCRSNECSLSGCIYTCN